MTRVLLIGDNPKAPSGFGQQMNVLAEGLATRGFEVIVISDRGPSYKKENLSVFHNYRLGDIYNIDRCLNRHKPDVVICFYHSAIAQIMVYSRVAGPNCPVYWWFFWESSSVPQVMLDNLRYIPPGHLICASEFTKNLWSSVSHSDVVIPCGISSDLFYKPRKEEIDRDILIKEWSKRLRFPLDKDGIILLNLDRHDPRKRWDLTFDYVKRLSKNIGKSVQLIAHCRLTSDDGSQNLVELAKLYGVYDQVCFTDFDWIRGLTVPRLVELYQLCTLRISTSMGEGFGLPTLEAALCGTLQLVPNHTSLPAILGEDNYSLYECCGTEYKYGSLWKVPDVNDMVRRTYALLNSDVLKEETLNRAYVNAKTFTDVEMINKWVVVINKRLAKERCWANHRFGFATQETVYKSQNDLAYWLLLLNPNYKYLEVGSFHGRFLKNCCELGLDIVGIDQVLSDELYDDLDETTYLRHDIVGKEAWPFADVCVLQSIVGLIYNNYSVEEFNSFVDRLSVFTWLFVDAQPCYRWDKKTYDFSNFESRLESRGMTRRYDLEQLLQSNKLNRSMTYQIWMRGHDTSIAPAGWISQAKGKQ